MEQLVKNFIEIYVNFTQGLLVKQVILLTDILIICFYLRL